MSDPQDEPFRMVISDVAFVKSQGVLIMGHVESGLLYPGDRIRIEGGKTLLITRTRAFNISQKIADVIQKDDDAAILLPKDVLREHVEAGMIVTKEADA